MHPDDRSVFVARAVRAILAPAVASPEALPDEAETIPEHEWMRGLVERARLEVRPHLSASARLQHLHAELLAVATLSESDPEAARREIAVLSAELAELADLVSPRDGRARDR